MRCTLRNIRLGGRAWFSDNRYDLVESAKLVGLVVAVPTVLYLICYLTGLVFGQVLGWLKVPANASIPQLASAGELWGVLGSVLLGGLVMTLRKFCALGAVVAQRRGSGLY